MNGTAANDNSLATTSMMSSQFSSPIESTEISTDWSKADRLPQYPLQHQHQQSSPSERTESLRVKFTQVPPPAVQQQQQYYQSAQASPQMCQSYHGMPTSPMLANGHQHQLYNTSMTPSNAAALSQNFQHGYNQQPTQMPYENNYNAQHYPILQNGIQTQHVIPTQSEWMQNILQQNRQQQSAGPPNNPGQVQRQGGIGGMRSYWEQRIRQETMERQHHEMSMSRLSLGPKQYLFPRWRSVDPMTASLVASSRTAEIIPRDSRIPEYRQEKLVETERSAQVDKFELHKPYIQMAICRQRQRRGRSLLAPRQPYESSEEISRRSAMAMYDEDTGQWYDPQQIKQAVSHESIANVGATRQMWEQTTWQADAQNRWDREQERLAPFAPQRYWHS